MQRSENDLINLRVIQAVPSTGKKTQGPTPCFNGSCPRCSAEVDPNALPDGGKQLAFADVSAKDADCGTGLACGDTLRRFRMPLPDGTELSGARVFVAVRASLPGWALAVRSAKFAGAISVMEVACRAFLPVRPILSKVTEYFDARAAHAPENHT
jgi:hypothetical protein